MDFFSKLGNHIYREWQARDFDESIFHEVASDGIRQFRPSEHVSASDVIDWVHDAPRLVPQGDRKSTFGSPPVAVFRSDRFYIEALFWVDSTTTIHQHGFSGAFHVLQGSSIHATYSFEQEHRFSDRLLTGKLTRDGVEHLRQGDTRPIRAGAALIHSLFHLDRPSVSIVVRTGSDPFGAVQYTYLRSGLAFDPFFTTDAIARQRQTLELLRTVDRPRFIDRARRTVEAADAFRLFHLMFALNGWLSDAEYDEFTRGLKSPHGSLVDHMRRLREESLREAAIIGRRERIKSAEHRFFLALLLNLTERDDILGMVRGYRPSAPPQETVCRWLSELATTRLDDGRNALDIELDEVGLRIVAHLIDGASDEQVMARLREEYDEVEEQRAGVMKMCQAFRKSLVLGGLVRAPR